MSLCALLHQEIARSDIRCEATRMRFYQGLHGTECGFEIFYFELLDPAILSAASSILFHLKSLHPFTKN